MRRGRIGRILVAVSLVGAGLAAAPAVASYPAEALLPDIGMAPLRDFSVQKRPKGERWLRFSAVIVNVGAGPFQAYGYNRNAAGQLQVDQEIWTPGDWVREPTTAQMYWSGDGHNHWHVRDLEQYVLEGQNGRYRLYGEKHGFCFWDNYRYNLNLDDAPTTAQYTGANSCGSSSSNATVQMGLSIGWGDIYPASITDQYINISSLPAGEYTVTATADWANAFVESNDSNNGTTARIRINKNGATLLDPGTGP
ncbi:MAG TPA: lysyl oxidase family protein [Candidatus Eisenbacteria bacterium]|nr:lysyl oxidase family protein [Candidatus Eisenbacteria bacterium]